MTDETAGKSGIESSRAFDLTQLVEYGEGSVVSRTLIENNAGTVTLFAFDAGQGLSEHTAPYDALVQIVDGAAEFTIGGDVCKLESGQIVLMPANIPHGVRATSRFKMLLTMLRKTK